MNHNRTKRLFAAVLATLALTVGFSGVVIASAPLASANGVALATGDVLASVGNGLVDNYSPSGTLLDTLNTANSGTTYTTGGCFDSAGNFYVTDFDSNAISEFSPGGNLLNATWATEPSTPESCTVDAKNNVYVGGQGAATIYEYNSSGAQINSFAVTGGSGTGGTDWLDIAADQCTILYTGEGSEILSYNVCTQTQNPDFATGLPSPCFELRIRPNGDVMVACASEILRYSSSAALLQTYPISTGLFSMNLDPDNTTLWTGDDGTGEIYHVDIATGAILGQFSSSPPVGLYGLTLVGAINVAQPTVTLSPQTATQAVGTTDTVTATITNPGGSISGQTVSFSVSGANKASGTAVTNASGQATFSYAGTNTGTDTVTATFSSGTGTATVTWTPPVAASTSVSTQLIYGGGKTGTAITVPAGTAVTDSATLSGTNAAKATGSVTYNVYSDNKCTQLVKAGTAQPITTAGLLPPSAAVAFGTVGTYYWKASYSGDASNAASASLCGSETETVTRAPTTLTTSVSGGGKSGTSIAVPAGTAVTDSATLTGAVASAAKGSVTYSLYTSCGEGGILVGGGSPQTITTAGVLPPSAAVKLPTAGAYYWAVSYSGDANNQPSGSSCGSETVTVTPAPTNLATSLSGGGKTGPAITVPQGSAVKDSATLSGAVSSGATGSVTYNVYSDNACTKPVSGGTSTVTVGQGGVIPSSSAVTLSAVGTYYWTASYSGDANNQASASKCGSETATVSLVAQPTTLATSLSGGGKTGTVITVTAGTAVTDSATLSGTNAATATGMVTYNVYSDTACTKLVKAGSPQSISTAGTLPKSAAVTLTTAGTYYWQVAYSGDTHNQASTSKCGAETETVTKATTTLATSLSGGGHTGTSITVQAGTAVTDTGTVSGAVASGATGTVTFRVYSNSTCTTLAASAGTEVVSGGKSHASAAVVLTRAGTYYWTASYSGDASNKASASACGSEKLTVIPLPAFDTFATAVGKSAATAKVTTTAGGDLLVALVAGRGPAAGGQAATVSGGGLTWHFVGRENAGRGDVEVWTAKPGGVLTGVSVKATAKTAGFTVTMTVVAFKHATGTGALAKATAASGAPKATLKTAHNNAWVLAMADDWAHSVTPKPAAGQFVVSRVADSTDTFWAQATSQLVAKAGTSVTISDSAPTTDPFDLIAVEVY